MIEVHSTKTWQRLACAHSQFFDKEPDGSPGECASVHGYDRSVTMTFSGEIDENGWIVPFGELQEVKKFLEFYFDHTIVLPANDKRLKDIPVDMLNPGGLFAKLRILPYGVSMEMSSLFIWELVSPYITHVTNGRCYVSRVECREHECNSAYVTADRESAKKAYETMVAAGKKFLNDTTGLMLNKEEGFDYIAPKDAIGWYNTH